MKPNYFKVVLAVALSILSYTTFSQIPGETCSSAQPLAIPSTVTGIAEDNWYIIQPEVTSSYEITTCSLNTCDTRLWVYSSCPSDLNTNVGLVAGNDDSCGLQAYLNVTLFAGETYYLRVGDFSNACTGPVTFSISSYEMNPGCTDPTADNYDAEANVDDGSCIIEGCTDASAMNYDSNATVDNGSCEFCNGEGSIIGTLYLCTFANPDQVELQILNSNGEIVAEMYGANGGAIQYGEVCLSPGECYTAVMSNNTGPNGWYNGYFWISYNGVQYINQSLDYGLEVETANFSIDGTCGPIAGCTDPNADNYDPTAQVWDGSCIYSGCTDQSAINYDWNANMDDGSCEYCTDGTVATIYVCTYSLGEQVELQILDSNGNEVIYIDNLWSNQVAYFYACLHEGECYTINMINNEGPYGWYNGYFWITVNGVQLTTGALQYGQEVASTIFSIDGTCGEAIIPGCTDPNALNFDADANINDGSCVYPVYGCMDESALNYNPAANVNEGCIYEDSCESNLITVSVSGSSWPTEISYVIYDASYNVVYQGVYGTGYICLEDGCYTVELYDSFGDGWNGGSLVVSYGGALAGVFNMPTGNYATGVFGINSLDCGLIISGCTDPLAMNYNPYAMEDDGSCIYPEPCDQESVTIAINTAIWANEVSWMLIDESGETVATGDNYSNYSNYVETFCLAPGCYQFVMEDNWGDGWNGAYYFIYGENTYAYGTLESGFNGTFVLGVASDCSQVLGCTDETAINYNADATVDDGSCFYVGSNPQNFAMNPNLETNFDLYPNPTSGIVTVDVTGLNPQANVSVKIVAMDGKLVDQFQINAGETYFKSSVDVSALSAGYYFVQMTNGEKMMTKPFVKE